MNATTELHIKNLQRAMFKESGLPFPGISSDEKAQTITVPEFMADTIEEALEVAADELFFAEDFAKYNDLLFRVTGTWIDEEGWVISYETWKQKPVRYYAG